jgi:hypothetical protein
MSWGILTADSGDIFRGSDVSQLNSNYTALALQESGAPELRLPYLNTASRDVLTMTDTMGMIIFNNDEQQYQGYDPVTNLWGIIGGGISIVQSNHGYTSSEDLGIPITLADSYVLADASTLSSANVLGLLSEITNSNNFEIQQTGKISLTNSRWSDLVSGGLLQGYIYYLQDSGASYPYDITYPIDPGKVNKPVIFSLTETEVIILNQRGIQFPIVSEKGYGSAGKVWDKCTTAIVANNWRSVTYGNGLFVAVAVSGTGNRVMTSPDGITWTIRTSAADNLWYGVTYGNGLFVAVAASGIRDRVMISS